MKKKIWLTSLESSQETIQKILASFKTYGLDVDGHFWEDDLEKMGWCKPRKELFECSMWVIHGSNEKLGVPSIRYGLSMLALTAQAAKGLGFPIVLLQEGEAPIGPASLPRSLAESAIYELGSAYGPKIIAALHKTVAKEFPPYRLDVYGIPQVGQWFEVGPRDGAWKGVIFATSEEGISLHAVGPAGQLPEKSTLNYPQQGIKLNIGDKEFDGWAVQNELDDDTSYFVKVDCHPRAVLFCPYSQEDEAEAYVIELQ